MSAMLCAWGKISYLEMECFPAFCYTLWFVKQDLVEAQWGVNVLRQKLVKMVIVAEDKAGALSFSLMKAPDQQEYGLMSGRGGNLIFLLWSEVVKCLWCWKWESHCQTPQIQELSEPSSYCDDVHGGDYSSDLGFNCFQLHRSLWIQALSFSLECWLLQVLVFLTTNYFSNGTPLSQVM